MWVLTRGSAATGSEAMGGERAHVEVMTEAGGRFTAGT